MGVEHHNQVLRRAEKRAAELEERLVDILIPVLEQAGDHAADAFQQLTYDPGDPFLEDLVAAMTVPIEELEARERDYQRRLAAKLAEDDLSWLHLSAAAPSPAGTMIALYPRPEEAARIAQEGGEPASILHVTLAYLGKTEPDSLFPVIDLLRQIATEHAPLVGTVGGVGSFLESEDGAPEILLPDVPGLVELRQCIVGCLKDNGVDYSNFHGYTPHITVAYGDGGVPDRDTLGEPLHFDALYLIRGDEEVACLPFSGPVPVTAREYSQARERNGTAPLRVHGGTLRVSRDAVPDQRDQDAVAEARPADGQRQSDVRTQGDLGRGERAAASRSGAPPSLRADTLPQPRPSRAEDTVAALAVTRPTADHLQASPASLRLPERSRDSRLPALQAGSGPAAPVKKTLTAAGGQRYCLTRELRGKTDPVRLAVIETVARTSVEGAGIAWDVNNPLIDKALSQSASQITEISRTTQRDVMRVIRKAYQQGYSVADTARLIRKTMRDTAATRARLIARTELAGAINGGSLAATQIVAKATGDTYWKVWLTATGAKHPRHEKYIGLNSQTVKLTDYFTVGNASLQYPGDPSGVAGEVCNCRCTMTYTDKVPKK